MGWTAAFLMLQAGTALAGSDNRLGTGGAPELRLPIGAQSTALAGANVGMVTGAEALFYNPAGVAGTDAPTTVMFSHTQYIADMDVNFVGVTQTMGAFGTIGLSVKVLSVGEIPFTSESAPDGTGETFSPTFSTLGVTWARKMTDRVNFGGTVGYTSEKIMQETAGGLAFDFGFQYDTDYQGLRLGMAMKNFGPNLDYSGSDFDRVQLVGGDDPQARGRNLSLSTANFELPSLFQFGASYPAFKGPNGAVTLHALYQNNSFAVDEGRFGAEFGYRKDAALRLGYKYTSNSDDLFGFTYGLGVRVPLGGAGLWVDYAGQTVSDFFDDVQHVSLNFAF